jgi:Shikimate 5-dehydrogenase
MPEIDGKTKLLCVIGDPIEHSQSPRIHNALAEQADLNYVYTAFRVTIETLPEFIEAAKTLPIAGFNVTMPLKSAVLPFLHSLDPIAEKCGAVNTVVNTDGKLTGYNTDGEGFIASIEGKAYKAPLILGTGGAAKAISAAFSSIGIDAIPVSVRNSWAELPKYAAQADIIVNATSLGMHGNEQFQNFDWLKETNACVYDIVYNPIETELLIAAKANGLKTIGGLELLQQQAEIAFKKFTDQK